MKPTLAVVISDTHFGGFTAVSPPEVQTDAGQVVKGNAAQAWLYGLWTDLFKTIKARLSGKRLIVVHGGDIVEGEHHDALAHLPDIKDQEALAVVMLAPWRNLADKMYLIRGTEAHAGNQHMSERRIAHELAADGMEFRLRLDLDGCLCDFAHHSSGTPHTIGLKVLQDCAKDGLPIPRYVMRGHRHVIQDTGAQWPTMRVLTLPGWQLRTSYGWKIAPNERPEVGAVIIEGGELEIWRYVPKATPIRKA